MRMDVFGTGLYVTVCLLLLSSLASGLRCFQCKDVHADSSSFLVKWFINEVSSENSYCKTSVTEDTPDVEVITCSPAIAGKVNKCAHLMGKSHVSVGLINVDVSLDFNTRACVQVDAREPDLCKAGKDSVQDETLLSTMLSLSSVAFGSYDGTKCLCSSDLCNGQTTTTASALTWLLTLTISLAFGR